LLIYNDFGWLFLAGCGDDLIMGDDFGCGDDFG
jgi:hypothetical protein